MPKWAVCHWVRPSSTPSFPYALGPSSSSPPFFLALRIPTTGTPARRFLVLVVLPPDLALARAVFARLEPAVTAVVGR